MNCNSSDRNLFSSMYRINEITAYQRDLQGYSLYLNEPVTMVNTHSTHLR